MRRRLGRLGTIVLALLLSPTLSTAIHAQEFCDPSVPFAIQPPQGGDFAPGCTEYYFRYGAPTDTTAGFTALLLPTCVPGCDDLICRVDLGYSCCVDSAWCVPAPSGDHSDPICAGLRYRFEPDLDIREFICFADYHGSGQRLLTVPVTTGRALDGSSCCPLIRMAMVFLTRHPSSKSFWASFVGYLDWTPIPTPARQSTWGSVKAIFR